MFKYLSAMFLTLVLAATCFGGCKPADVPTARSYARSVLYTMAVATKAARITCGNTAEALVNIDPANLPAAMDLAEGCANATQPVKDALLALSETVDNWDPNVSQNEMLPAVACTARVFVDGVSTVAKLLVAYKVSLPNEVVDALSLVGNILPQCKSNEAGI